MPLDFHPVRSARLAIWLAAALLALAGCSVDAESGTGWGDEPETGTRRQATEVEAKPHHLVTHRLVRTFKQIPFTTRDVRTNRLDMGATRVGRAGREGRRVTVWRVTLRDGKRVGRRVVRTFVARRPAARIVLHGTHVDPPQPARGSTSSCDSNYAGACVPISSDVDCAGGSGDGPDYVAGPVTIVGTDIYGLDSDGDGVACES